MTGALDFRELHRELVDEFFHYADKRGRSYLESLTLMYWRARGPAFAGCAANLPGTKYMVSTDDASRLGELVRKALMLSDHVIIRHATKLPPHGVVLDAIPADFAGFGPVAWIEQHRADLPGTRVLPHFGSSPPPPDVKPFIEWLCGEGRGWFETHQVTYAPVLVPAEVDVALFAEGVNVNHFFREANVLPDEARRLNKKAAQALADLRLPYVDAVTPELLRAFKVEEEATLRRFQHHLLRLIETVGAETGTPEFSREVERVSADLAEETHGLEAAIQKHAKSQSWQRVGAEILGLSASVFFLLDLPQAAVAGLTAAAVAVAKQMKDALEAEHSIKQHPLYALTHIGAVGRRPANWHLSVRRAAKLG